MILFIFGLLLVAVGSIYFGFYCCVWLISKYLIDSSEAEILAKIRKIKNKAKEYENDC